MSAVETIKSNALKQLNTLCRLCFEKKAEIDISEQTTFLNFIKTMFKINVSTMFGLQYLQYSQNFKIQCA